MKLAKHLIGLLLLTFMYFFTVVLAMGTVTITPGTQVIGSGDSVGFTTTVSGTSGATTFDRFIDGVALTGVTTSSLVMPWTTYIGYFPADLTTESVRTVTIQVSDSASVYTGTATLAITHPTKSTALTNRGSGIGGQNYCGDARLREDLGEECDDGNGKQGDGCTINCFCENGWLCTKDENGKSVMERVSTDATSGSDSDDSNENGNGSGDNQGNSDGDDDKVGVPLKEQIANRNRDPLILSDDADSRGRAPLSSPEAGANPDDPRRLMSLETDGYMTKNAPAMSIDSRVQVPSILPRSGEKERFSPKRVTIQ